ncbi:hypothetical protein ETAA8_06170 [Anatilimnocola aggregata]|uniref:Uncharacterized protein n=1 Tax=Anatilimnocola aggregata TaxID=2528021 RepID=A0A517Y5N3_9BACT|nr:hypothetical protein [Anatilimnocola aggregata]QDU25548.1 hypothetical protein ETAA8_06170 [Anatilimnocola aggregata]
MSQNPYESPLHHAEPAERPRALLALRGMAIAFLAVIVAVAVIATIDYLSMMIGLAHTQQNSKP